jgi:nicotinamidase/pyrazinamidase
MMDTLQLLLIDPQIDFCDLPASAAEPTRPARPVPGAHQDMLRLADFITRTGAKFGAIHVTLDSHHPLHIAHLRWWVDAEGRPPAPFTVVRAADVHAGKWRARNPAWRQRSRAYVDALEAGGRYTLVI